MLICAGIFLPFCLSLLAQESVKATSIVLVVKDQTGGKVQGAHVRIWPLPSKMEKVLDTDSDGKLLLDVSPGSYDLTVEFPGFVTATKSIEAKYATHQTIDIVLRAGSCSPCVITAVLPVSFPEQSLAISPDGRYAIVGVDSAAEPHHTVFLEDLFLKTRRKLFNYDRHVALLWKPDSKLFAVTNYVGSDKSQCTIILVDEKMPPIQVLDVLSRQLTAASRKQLEIRLSNQHSYVEASAWDGSMTLEVKISGYGDADPAGFTEFFDVLLPDGQP